MPKSDLEIVQSHTPEDIEKIASKAGINANEIERYGRVKAKVDLAIFDRLKSAKDGRLILVTAINPTPAGEGKSTTTVGLGQALSRLGKNAMIALREPSLGPIFGIKGGAAGGGYSQVVPMEDLNLHFTGDIHAVTTANNLIAAMLDNHLYQGNELDIDVNRITWKRAIDMNDRALRNITVGLGGLGQGIPRQDGFNISVASEVMAVLTLARDIDDLKNRLGRMVIAYSKDRTPITVRDLKAEGAVAMVLKDAIKPNLVQTLEGTPALVHGGPFANIAHGCNSIIATKLALKLSDYVVTEAGFGADLGAEKFLNIKTQDGDLTPNAVVIVATIRALKMHGGQAKDDLAKEDLDALEKGFENLEKHIDTIQAFNLPYVVAINEFPTDTEREIHALSDRLEKANHAHALSRVFFEGGKGGEALADAVLKITEGPAQFKPLYTASDSLKTKIETIAHTVYGATNVVFSDTAKRQLRTFKKHGWDTLKVCMAKTQSSLSDDPKKLGRPRDFTLTIRELRPSIGAGFIVALTGNMMTMPGLPKVPSAVHMKLHEDGRVDGLF